MTPDERLTKTIALLESIDRSLKVLVQQRATVTTPGAAATKAIADDRDLDSDYGDPVVKVDPRDWSGESMKGRHFSECPPEYLDLAAEMYEYFATKAEEKNEQTSAGKPVAPYKRKDAARARGWAKRLRSRPAVSVPTAVKDDSPPWEESQW